MKAVRDTMGAMPEEFTWTDAGVAELIPDAASETCWTLLVDDWAQSFVDTADARHLRWDYARRLAAVIDSTAEPGAPISALHLGGGALALPRYVATTRPGSTQLVVDRDAALVALVRRVLPLPEDAGIDVLVADARDALTARPAGYDLVLTDVFNRRQQVPARFTSVEFATEVARTLHPGGQYALNIADSPSLEFTRGQAATLRKVFADVCLLADPGMLRGGRFGNVVLAAAHTPLQVPLLMDAMAGDPRPAQVLHGADLDWFIADAPVVTDETATNSPAPPPPYGN
jgi:hypothetical protein